MARYDDEDDDLDISRGRGEPVPNYLVQSILVTLCCCLPLGIVAIIQSAKVNGLVEQGKISEAVAASDAAKKYCWIGFAIGLVINVLNVGRVIVEMQNQGAFR